jgi:hypothetical protein
MKFTCLSVRRSKKRTTNSIIVVRRGAKRTTKNADPIFSLSTRRRCGKFDFYKKFEFDLPLPCIAV